MFLILEKTNKNQQEFSKFDNDAKYFIFILFIYNTMYLYLTLYLFISINYKKICVR